jgi:hypothetical protein
MKPSAVMKCLDSGCIFFALHFLEVRIIAQLKIGCSFTESMVRMKTKPMGMTTAMSFSSRSHDALAQLHSHAVA